MNKKQKIILIYGILLLIYILLLIFDKTIYSIFAINAPQNIKESIFFIQNDLIIFPLIFIFGILCIVLKRKNKKDKRKKLKKELFAFTISVVIAMLISFIFKTIIYKPRPDILLGFDSFPSGHATLLFTLFPFIKENSRVVGGIYFFFTGLVLLSRFLFGYHYLSDLLAGAVIGYSISLIFKINYTK